MSTESIDIRVAGRNFTLACESSERADLEAAIALVTERVDEAHAASASANGDRLLLLAAVNLAHDLRRTRAARGGVMPEASSVPDHSKHLTALRERIDAALR